MVDLPAPDRPVNHRRQGRCDLASARAINQEVAQYFAEQQIYRIDHYLGKETVQNILALRFANQMFEPLWNANHIDHVQITMAEDFGVEDRGHFYDPVGALRDVVVAGPHLRGGRHQVVGQLDLRVLVEQAETHVDR